MRKVPIYYYRQTTNFGDKLNIDILRKLFQIEPVWASAKEAKLVCIGSLLESFLHGSSDVKLYIKKHIYPALSIWGTGFISHENDVINRGGAARSIF